MKRKRILMLLGYYDHNIHKGIVKYAHEANWILETSNFYRYRELPKNWKGDGILAFVDDRDNIVNFINRTSVPVVDMGWKWKKPKLPKVYLDNYAIGKMGAEYFISKGLNKAFAVLGGAPLNKSRWEGFRDTFQKHGWAVKVDMTDLIEALKSSIKPCGILVANDYYGVTIQNTLLENNYRIPEDIALLGINNDTLQCDLAQIPLSSIDCNLFGRGYKAAEVLDGIIDGAPPPEEPVLVPPVGVVERMSTDIMAIKHRNLKIALKEIHNNFRENISCEQIARKAGMSRRNLDEVFLKYLGLSMFDEITRIRLLEAKKLLRETDMAIENIALESGFSNLRHLDRAFLRVEETKPSQYRKMFKH